MSVCCCPLKFALKNKIVSHKVSPIAVLVYTSINMLRETLITRFLIAFLLCCSSKPRKTTLQRSIEQNSRLSVNHPFSYPNGHESATPGSVYMERGLLEAFKQLDEVLEDFGKAFSEWTDQVVRAIFVLDILCLFYRKLNCNCHSR